MTDYTTITSSKQTYIKISSANWESYKFQSLNYFYEVDGEDIMNEKEKQPEELIEEKSGSSSSSSSSISLSSMTFGSPEQIEFRRNEIKLHLAKKKKIYLYLVNTQSEETIPLIRHLDRGDAVGCWKILCDHYESKTLASIKQLMSQLIRCKYDASQYHPGLTLKFAGEIERISNQLKQAIEDSGKDILDVLKTLIFIDGLPLEFEVMKQITLMNDEADFEKAKEDALQKDQRLQFEKLNLEEGLSPSVVFSSRSDKTVVCNYCHKPGHIENECRKKKRETETEPSAGKGAKGGKKGPPSKNKPSSTSASASQSTSWVVQRVEDEAGVDPIESKHVPSAAMATGTNTPRKMCIDSACTDHVHKDKLSISDFNPNDKLNFRQAEKHQVVTDGSGTFGPLRKVHVCNKFAEHLFSVNQLWLDEKAIVINPHHGIYVVDDTIPDSLVVKKEAILATGAREKGNSYVTIRPTASNKNAKKNGDKGL